MTCPAFLISTVAILPFARAIAFGGPAPTGTATNADRAVAAWEPEPTKGPSIAELRRRAFDLSYETCGWIDGDSSSGVSCNIGRTCMLYTASGVGMAGCCDGFDTQECAWANSCIDYDAYNAGNCDSDCLFNTFVRKCTDITAPYCVTWTYPSDNVADYGCVSTIAGVETVLQELTDVSTASVSLPTISGSAVTGWDGEASTISDSADLSSDLSSDLFTTTESGSAGITGVPSSGGSSSSKKSKKKVGVALIAGAVVGALVLLFVIGAIIIFICAKKKKSKQLAANQQAIAAAQASRPQSAYPPQQPQMQQPMPPPPQTPQPYYEGYFSPTSQQDQKYNPQTQAHEYGLQSPVSNPPTPAPAYVQPYYAAPPTPTQPQAYIAREPTPGTHEVDAITVPRLPTGHGPVYEMGPGK